MIPVRMSGTDRPRLIEDATGRKKLKISLPGGRYQLSLDDGGVNLLCDRLGYGLRDVVPDIIVKILVATGDAWFPHQRDYQSVIEDLPNTTHPTDEDLTGVAEYLRSKRVTKSRIGTVRDIVDSSQLTRWIDPDEIQVKELPTPPEGIFDEEISGSEGDEPTRTGAAKQSGSTSRSSGDGTSAEPESVDVMADQLVSRTSKSRSYIETRIERLLDRGASPEIVVRTLERQFVDNRPQPDLFDIPGVGTIRGYNLIKAGLDSVDQLAEARPAELAEATHLDEATATMIVEGARELLGEAEPTAVRLARQTNTSKEDLEAVLSLLAAAGVPPSASTSTLRELHGPSIVEIDAVDGRMAYFLYEAGYTTLWEIAQASLDELESVDYLGPSTAETVRTEARTLIESS